MLQVLAGGKFANDREDLSQFVITVMLIDLLRQNSRAVGAEGDGVNTFYLVLTVDYLGKSARRYEDHAGKILLGVSRDV